MNLSPTRYQSSLFLSFFFSVFVFSFSVEILKLFRKKEKSSRLFLFWDTFCKREQETVRKSYGLPDTIWKKSSLDIINRERIFSSPFFMKKTNYQLFKWMLNDLLICEKISIMISNIYALATLTPPLTFPRHFYLITKKRNDLVC